MPLMMTIALAAMMGQAAYDEKAPAYHGPAIELGAVHGVVEHEGTSGRVTISIFTEGDHKFVTSMVTKKQGKFHFADLPMGHYRLVASGGDACPLNVPVDVVMQGMFGQHGGHLVLHMKPQTPKSCSTVSFERN